MIRRIAKLPFKIVKGLLNAVRDGGRDRPFPGSQEAAPPPRRAAYTAPPQEEDDHGHDHGHEHEHGGGGGVSVSFEGTPNPNAMKFMLSCVSVEKGSLSFNSAEEAAGNPLGERLFAIPGVIGVFAVADFVTVTKDATAGWGRLTHPIVEALEAIYG